MAVIPRRRAMNLNNDPTLEQFRELLERHDDRAGHHVLWVRRDGEGLLTCLPKSTPRGKLPTYEHRDVQARFDTFPVGYGYVGPLQEDDDGWFRGELFRYLCEQWPRLKGVPGFTHLRLDDVAPYGRPVDAEEAAGYKREREKFALQKQPRQREGCPDGTAEQREGTARMNLNDNPTLEQFRELLRQHDDRAGHHVLWVREDGEVMLTCLPKGEDDPRKLPTYEHRHMRIRYDTFARGRGYVGEAGAAEDWWM